ncbi:pilus assembly protein [Aeromicrobium panaciterrae]|uniref:TadE/TadG family type IV pilus assembly protein n=1 Tax=Aeromicrobium panaciterrae TaxID=363861 RepID=UPI0031D3D610
MTRTRKDERGSMAVEVVIMIPILFMFTLLVVAGGRYVSVRADIEAAARDAARAASYERSYDSAANAASDVATSALDGYATCRVGDLGGDFESGGDVEVTLTCDVPNEGLGLIGLTGSLEVRASASAPLDTYRRTE